MKVRLSLGLALMMAMSSGCVNQSKEVSDSKKEIASGNYLASAKKAEEKAKDDLYWSLVAASSYRNAVELEKSNKLFDSAEEMYKKYNESDVVDKVKSGAASILINDQATDYTGQVYEGVLINTYKAMNFLTMSDVNNARVEFNRAADRQRRAKETFAQEIAEREKELNDNKNATLKQVTEDKSIQDQISKKYSNLDAFEAYPAFVNPYTTYLSGLFSVMASDNTKALDSLKESYGMTKNPVIKSDFEDVQNKKDLKGMAWVVLENGMGPSKKTFRIDIPLPNGKGGLAYVGIALPELKFGDKAVDAIQVESAPGTFINTSTFASMDSVVVNEFKSDLPAIRTRAIASAILKTAMQVQAQKKDSLLGSVLAVSQAATTQADERIWTDLPKEFQVARVKIPENGQLKLNINGQEQLVDLSKASNAIVTVKLSSKTAKPVVLVSQVAK